MKHTIQDSLVNCQLVKLFESTSESCDDIAMNIYERIRHAREQAGYTQKELAALLSVSQQAVQQWEDPDGTQPKTNAVRKLASLLGVPVEWILSGKDEENLPYSLAPRCPLIGWGDAQEWPKNRDFLKSENKIIYPGNQVVLSGNCYMLQVEDNSMISHMEAKGFQKGKYIIVDPSKQHESENFIVAKKNGLSKLLFRQYINDGESEYLNPLNIAHYKRIDLTTDIQVCGVVVAYLDILI